MAASMQVPMAACSIPRSHSSQSLRRRPIRTLCAYIGDGARLFAADPNDPFLRRLSWVSENFPEKLHKQGSNSDTLPFMETFDPKLTYSRTAGDTAPGYDQQKKASDPPPDIPSQIFEKRVVYIGLPMMDWVVELVFLEILFLQIHKPDETIYLYINSSGTTGEDGVKVASESGGLTLYDVMMRSRCEVHTLCCGAAMGHACLLLAAGTKGKRYMMAHGRAAIQQPRMPPSELMGAGGVLAKSHLAKNYYDSFVESMAKHTGNSEETVADKMRAGFYMDARGAKEFGVIDEIVGLHHESKGKGKGKDKDKDG